MSEFTDSLSALLRHEAELRAETLRPGSSKERPAEANKMRWCRDLPDYYAAMDMWEQTLHPGDRGRVARDPDNLQRGQLVRLGAEWWEIWDMTPDRYGCVLVLGSGYKRREYPRVIQEAARRAGELEALRQQLETEQRAA